MTEHEKLIRALRCTGKINCDMNCNACAFHQTKHDIMSLDLLATDDLLKLADLINVAADVIEQLAKREDEEESKGTGCCFCTEPRIAEIKIYRAPRNTKIDNLLFPQTSPEYKYCPICGRLLKGGT